ncbi:MAG: cupin domain-containing protein [Desulfovibrio sp.]|nr:cupin domain-containing protein [Desulfovibrio sp.]
MKKLLFLVALCSLLFGGSAIAGEPQLYPKDQLKTWNRDHVAKGEGTLFGQFAYTRNDATKDMVIKEIGWMTLKPGDSIGMHKHENNEDSYIIVSGEGVFTDSAGKETPVKAGDVTIARPGDAHALKNTGKEPLVFLDIIAQR